MSTSSFFWHDYETFGTDPQRDKVCQFAGIRTDMDFKPIGKPIMLYCQTSIDYLPHPEACLITGITPQIANERGVCEAEFTRRIHQQLATAGTCGLGYNSIRFDDEVTRNLLYRNFYDPYAREWQHQNSRWDIIDLVRAARALRPTGINWPVNNEGLPSLRLEDLTKANNISHTAAHDALADVYATIALTQLIRERQPKLYDFLLANRSKAAVQKILQLGTFTPVVHISGRFPTHKNCLAIMLPLCLHPTNQNEVVAYDLATDPGPLLNLTATQIQQRLFVANDALPTSVERIPLKTIHINKCPVLAPIAVISPTDADRLHIDLALCQRHLDRIKAAPPLTDKLATVYNKPYAENAIDPDLMIYSGGFFSNRDKASFDKIRLTKPAELANFSCQFDDDRCSEMLFRYRARNYPETLLPTELNIWEQFCYNRLTQTSSDKTHNFTSFLVRIKQLQTELDNEHPILKQLIVYAEQLELRLSHKANIIN
jgi:exodeoxyribonuclease-1